jgi:hypothetical protein
MRLDRLTTINILVEGFSGDNVATPDADSLQIAITNCLFDGCTFTRTVLSGCIDIETPPRGIGHFE